MKIKSESTDKYRQYAHIHDSDGLELLSDEGEDMQSNDPTSDYQPESPILYYKKRTFSAISRASNTSSESRQQRASKIPHLNPQ